MSDAYLYRAVNTQSVGSYDVEADEIDECPPGSIVFGRQSGYLSRSAAVDAGRRSGHPYEVVRSEPVVFLTRRQKLEREIDRLRAELDAELTN